MNLNGVPINISTKKGTKTKEPFGSAFPRPCRNTGIIFTSGRAAITVVYFLWETYEERKTDF